MSVRFTSGGVGRFGFDEANATLEAADAMVGRFNDAGKPQLVEMPKPLVVRLTQDHGASLFHPGPKNTQYNVWSWTQVAVSIDGAKRRIAPAPNGKAASKFGEMPFGRAIQLGGKATVGETVVLFRLFSMNGEPWFCFSGRPDVLASVTSVLKINSELEIAPGIYRYDVSPVYLDINGGQIPNAALQGGPALNLYELSQFHNQDVEFDDPPGRLVRDGSLKGPVLGTLANEPGQPILWAFDAPVPLRPQCGGPLPGQEDSALRGGI